VCAFAGFSGGASAALTLTADDFNAGTQSLDANGSGTGQDCSVVVTAAVAGGERDVCANQTGGPNAVEIDVPVGAGNYSHSQNDETFGNSEIQWDGLDGDPITLSNQLNLDLSGCAPEDQRFELGVNSVNLGTGGTTPTATLSVYEGGTEYSQTITLQEKPGGGAPDVYDFLFSNYAGFDFETTPVEAITLLIDGEDDEATDISLAFLKTCEPKNGNGKKVPAIGLLGAGVLGLSLAAFGAVAGFRRRR
jgi:hypothetical protein